MTASQDLPNLAAAYDLLPPRFRVAGDVENQARLNRLAWEMVEVYTKSLWIRARSLCLGLAFAAWLVRGTAALRHAQRRCRVRPDRRGD